MFVELLCVLHLLRFRVSGTKKMGDFDRSFNALDVRPPKMRRDFIDVCATLNVVYAGKCNYNIAEYG